MSFRSLFEQSKEKLAGQRAIALLHTKLTRFAKQFDGDQIEKRDAWTQRNHEILSCLYRTTLLTSKVLWKLVEQNSFLKRQSFWHEANNIIKSRVQLFRSISSHDTQAMLS